jgi:hypothetical protein
VSTKGSVSISDHPILELIAVKKYAFKSSRTDGDFCHQGRDTEIGPKNVRLSQHTDMTIHWKALEKHFLMVSLCFRCNYFRGKKKRKKSFSEFENLGP